MDNRLYNAILNAINKNPDDITPYRDMLSLLRGNEQSDFALVHTESAALRERIQRHMPRATDVEAFYREYRNTLLFDAPHSFDAYMLYLEQDRKPKERFYQPRRKVLLPAVQMIQDLFDDRLDEGFLELPPRVGKSTLLSFLMTFIIGRDSEHSNLYTAYSDIITKAFYNGILEILNDPQTYLWNDVFPEAKIVNTNAQDETIDINRRKRYPSLTCRSIYGTLNGACDCNGFEIADDLVGGIEEVLNKDRMVSLWSKVDNNYLPRAKMSAKNIWCGTRWSVIDPAGIREEMLTNDPKFCSRRFRVVRIPALNENDESNFTYAYGVGFDTEYYHQRRASFERNNDIASWNAQYMQEPIEREGTLFAPADFRYYNGELPEGEPDRIFLAVDPAFGGGDFVAAPVCVQYGDDIYVPAVVYDDSDKRVTQKLIADIIEKYRPTTVQIEANKSTESYAEEVNGLLKERGIKVNLTTKAASTAQSKVQRIFDKAPDIREKMIFLGSGHRTREYEQFMQNVFGFKVFANTNKQHDDAPDSLAMAIAMLYHEDRRAVVFRRPF